MTIDPEEFPAIVIEREGALVTLRMRSPKDAVPGSDLHWEMGELLTRLRGDNECRVIVLTGYRDGTFLEPGPATAYASQAQQTKHNDPERHWRIMLGMTRMHEALVGMEKPVIARVNGNVVGFGSSIMFACDLAVAVDDAIIYDHHISNGEQGLGSPYGVVPGDGGIALVPSHFSPMKAKEYLMLAKNYTGRELADMNVINYAVPADELDDKVDELVHGLLRQSAYALAWTKRLANRAVRAQVDNGIDAASAFEIVNFYQTERNGWQPHASL